MSNDDIEKEWQLLRSGLPSPESVELEAPGVLPVGATSKPRVYPSVIASRGQCAPRFVLRGFTRDELPPTKSVNPPVKHIGWLYKRGGGTSMFGSKGWKRRRFYLSGSVLRYFKSQKELDAFEAGFGTTSPASPTGQPQLAAGDDRIAGNAAGQGPTEPEAIIRSKSLNLVHKFPVVDTQASSGRTAPSIRRRRVQSSGAAAAAAALTLPVGSPLARAADSSQSSGSGSQSVPPTLPRAAAGGSSGGNGSGSEPSSRLGLPVGLGLGAAAGGSSRGNGSGSEPSSRLGLPVGLGLGAAAGGAGHGGAGPGMATGSGGAGSEAGVTSAGAQSPTTAGAAAGLGLGAIVVYGGWMRRLRGYEEATRNHVLLLLPPLGHRVYFVSAESELELQGWERALRLGGMRDVPPDDDSELPPG